MQLTLSLPWASVRRALYMLMLLISQTRRVLVSASPSAKGAKTFVFSLSGRFNPVTGSVLFPSSALPTAQLPAAKTSMEIREEDFFFQDDAQERPVIQVVSKDVKTADIFTVMQAIGSEDESATEDGTSWWKDAVTEEFTRQDVVVLALIAICIIRLVGFGLQVLWKLVKLPFQWYNALNEEKEEKERNGNQCHDGTAVQLRKELTIVHYCHLHLLLVIEKLKREMKDGVREDTQQMVAELDLSLYREGAWATLTEILMTVQKIQLKDSTFKVQEVEANATACNQDVRDEEDIKFHLLQAWERLRETYASFHRIQATILRRQNRKKSWQWQLQHHEKTSGWRQRRLLSSEDPMDEVLQELQELTRELPQGFTADMFTSLGNAMHEKAVALEPETSPASSQRIDADLLRAGSVVSIPKADKYSATAQKAA